MIDFSKAPAFGRIGGLTRALELVEERTSEKPFIIETGTSRGDLGGGIQGDGQATALFAWYCRQKSGRVWTIDIEEEAIANCKELTKDFKDCIDYFVSDSSQVIAKAQQPISLLYLDSGNDPELALAECKAAMKNLNDNSVVLIDDSSIKQKRMGGINKGALVFKFLYDRGWDLVFDDGNQIILINSGAERSSLGDRIRSIFYGFKVKAIHRRAIRKGAI